jgi:hypothetical protein
MMLKMMMLSLALALALALPLVVGSRSGRLWSAPEAAIARYCHCGQRLLMRTAVPGAEPLSGCQDGRPSSIHTRWQRFVG